MQKHSKITISLLGICSLALLTSILPSKLTESDLVPPAQPGSKWDLPMQNEDLPLQSILEQPFTFLAKGHQALVFVSADGQYVLKLLKPHYPKIHLWGVKIPLRSFSFGRRMYSFFGKKEQQIHKERDFTSYCNAFHSFKKESLLEYVHIVATNHLNTKIHCIDKKGHKAVFRADKIAFIIQKKAEPLAKTFQDLVENHKEGEALTLLANLRELILKRAELGFYQPTHKMHANFGCIGTTPVQIDIGRLLTLEDLQIDPSTVSIPPPEERMELLLRVFLEKYCPTLLSTPSKTPSL